MDYFERCKIRIENAKFIDVDYYRTFSLYTKYMIDEELVLRKTYHRDSSTHYSITFRDISVPMDEEKIKCLFELTCKKLDELNNVKNEEILREL